VFTAVSRPTSSYSRPMSAAPKEEITRVRIADEELQTTSYELIEETHYQQSDSVVRSASPVQKESPSKQSQPEMKRLRTLSAREQAIKWASPLLASGRQQYQAELQQGQGSASLSSARPESNHSARHSGGKMVPVVPATAAGVVVRTHHTSRSSSQASQGSQRS